MIINLLALLLFFSASNVAASTVTLPEPTSQAFCSAVQAILADTTLSSSNVIFDDMPEYRHSKPVPRPLSIYQVVSYHQRQPIMVSCKVKTADHLRAEYGEKAAGQQKYCPHITRLAQAQAVAELSQAGLTEAAVRAKAFVIEDNEPFVTGRSYLASFPLSYQDDSGRVHINTPGLQTDWENLLFWPLPNSLRGQTYCHIATVSYLKSLATQVMTPGMMMTTADDAPTRAK
ncbi:hypothetical protein [Oceanicoccus sagamiensis]|uniref:Uncharacterized protein n=1 Tax=Oceanicoccus sagamiensis TaxID=716816 RepID=A0A1X9N4Q5_9GAMM|nr:hypothetical protein [Oceanicoccus sagamiensis]ARN73118.1 hypothetical protein BST96_02750 [Oceanicoccus sagamiensis]